MKYKVNSLGESCHRPNDYYTKKVCVAYELNGEQITHFPSNADDFARCKPILKTLPGWKCSTDNCKKLED